ncbi:60S ribosomal protein L36a [Hordeum vulgare]|nr:60S ribosomal protein L36a [Hordeum vulgare]
MQEREVDPKSFRETTPKRSRLTVSIEADDKIDERPTIDQMGTKLQKKEEETALGGTYKEELVALIEAKKVLTAERKKEKMTRWNELKVFKDKN